MEAKKKKKKAQEFMDKVMALIKEYQMPSMMVLVDNESKQTGIIMDRRENAKPMNKAMLMDAMVNADASFMNLVFDAVATIIALSPAKMHKEFEEYIQKVRDIEEQNKHKIITNTAEA